ncbi:MAG TPA: arylamine N-acetyltransferase, partial [Gammaproteobacteria bacterium]|nr:arylamine N-acetyltransferase [Gammaproteobacteria bacterium]
ENLSNLLGDPVPLQIDALENKMITGRRGGYCFEQNALFQHVLDDIGFEVTPIAARVVWSADKGPRNPRTHMALLVSIDTERYLCDVGFGAATQTAPLVLDQRQAQSTPHERYRIRSLGELLVLEIEIQQQWRPAYEFDLQPQEPIDYEAMNHFVQTHPTSHFPHVLMACRPDDSGRFTLRDNEFRRYESGQMVSRRTIDTAPELERVLGDEFRIELPSAPGLKALLDDIAGRNAA